MFFLVNPPVFEKKGVRLPICPGLPSLVVPANTATSCTFSSSSVIANPPPSGALIFVSPKVIVSPETNKPAKSTSTIEPLVLSEQEQISDEKEKPFLLKDSVDESVEAKSKKTFAPSARKIATEAKINLDEIHGSGKNGLILKEDVMKLMGYKPKPSERKINHGPEERIKMTRLRLTIAKRLKEAQENAAMLTTFNEVDMTEVISMRNKYKEEFQNIYSVKLGFMSFFVKACVVGLKKFSCN